MGCCGFYADEKGTRTALLHRNRLRLHSFETEVQEKLRKIRRGGDACSSAAAFLCCNFEGQLIMYEFSDSHHSNVRPNMRIAHPA